MDDRIVFECGEYSTRIPLEYAFYIGRDCDIDLKHDDGTCGSADPLLFIRAIEKNYRRPLFSGIIIFDPVKDYWIEALFRICLNGWLKGVTIISWE
jgi:hypothetical protein